MKLNKHYFYIFCISTIFTILLVRTLFMIHVAKNYINIKQTSTNSVIKDRLKITDRNGHILVDNIESYDFYINLSKIINPIHEIEKIQKSLTTIKPETLVEKFANAKLKQQNIVLIKKGILYHDKKRLQFNGVLGMELEKVSKRFYVNKNLFSHILGFVSTDSDGLAGIEKSYNSYLSTPENQESLQLTVDLDVQFVLYNFLKNNIEKYNAKGGYGIVANIKTGEVIAATSLPDFDPNKPQLITDETVFNKFSLGVYELGSIFKIFTMALALENNWSLDRMCYREGNGYQIQGKTIRDFNTNGQSANKSFSLLDVFRFSSSICCAKVVEEIGVLKQYELFKKVGLMEKLETDLPEIGRPIVKKSPSLIDGAVASYGYGIAVSPLHFTYAAGNLLNGHKTNLTFIKQNTHQNHQSSLEKITSNKTRTTLNEMLYYVFKNNIKMSKSNYPVGIKTATAIQQKGGVYDSKDMIISMFASFPVLNPEYVYLVGLNAPYADDKNEKQIQGSVLTEMMFNLVNASVPFLNR